MWVSSENPATSISYILKMAMFFLTEIQRDKLIYERSLTGSFRETFKLSGELFSTQLHRFMEAWTCVCHNARIELGECWCPIDCTITACSEMPWMCMFYLWNYFCFALRIKNTFWCCFTEFINLFCFESWMVAEHLNFWNKHGLKFSWINQLNKSCIKYLHVFFCVMCLYTGV